MIRTSLWRASWKQSSAFMSPTSGRKQPTRAGFAPLVALVDRGGARTLLIVPMLKEHALVGAFGIYRQEVRPFTAKQMALVENFAAQAVIAIENARLLRELRERTEEVVELNERLERRVTDQVGEIERMGRLRRFLPPQVADLIVASGTEKQLESHRREITALFCDLRGFTGFTESADAEDVIALLREYHAAIGEKIIKYSGTLERYAGDGVMVVFNDPVPVDNPALQAVLMALEMREAIGGLTETWRRWGHDIGFGIGIAHGFATLGTIGFEGRFDYAAIGTVSNVASRLCDEAKPGQILISPRHICCGMPADTHSRIRDTIRGRYKRISDTVTSSTRCATRNCHRRGSKIFGVKERCFATRSAWLPRISKRGRSPDISRRRPNRRLPYL